MSCLLPFLGLWAPVVKPHPVRNTGLLPKRTHHRCGYQCQISASSWALYSMTCSISHFSQHFEYCALVVALSFIFMITNGAASSGGVCILGHIFPIAPFWIYNQPRLQNKVGFSAPHSILHKSLLKDCEVYCGYLFPHLSPH